MNIICITDKTDKETSLLAWNVYTKYLNKRGITDVDGELSDKVLGYEMADSIWLLVDGDVHGIMIVDGIYFDIYVDNDKKKYYVALMSKLKQIWNKMSYSGDNIEMIIEIMAELFDIDGVRR